MQVFSSLAVDTLQLGIGIGGEGGLRWPYDSLVTQGVRMDVHYFTYPSLEQLSNLFFFRLLR